MSASNWDATCHERSGRGSGVFGYYCTLDADHEGQHEAHGPLPEDRLIHAWDRT